MNESHQAYAELAAASRHETGVGGALISMVEPHQGTEYVYNRWYEDDHFYAGALYMPWMFAGRRFVATRELQLLRYPDPSPIAEPLTAGCYLHLYWITPGHVDDHIRWSVATNQVLRAADRIHLERRHVFTAFQDFGGSWRRDVRGPRDFHALDHPYAGVVMEVLDAPEGGTRADLDAYLREEYLPWVHRTPENPIGQSVWFAPRPLPADKQPDVADIPGLERRLTLLHFLDVAPQTCWGRRFAGNGERAEAGGRAHVRFAAPFIPVVPGTDRYTDELR
ncbi:hypothetical protein [Yinghuangia sp. YIM S09857]|uniref:hypothetical protein n=1 Tax=Yinghuangia sp. YIM S09857 TaxID=3436929 RepID=UPI003F53BF51